MHIENIYASHTIFRRLANSADLDQMRQNEKYLIRISTVCLNVFKHVISTTFILELSDSKKGPSIKT